MVGAEKMPAAGLAERLRGKFGDPSAGGLRLHRVLTRGGGEHRDVRGPNVRQTGNRPGTIGLPLPGMCGEDRRSGEGGEPCSFRRVLA